MKLMRKQHEQLTLGMGPESGVLALGHQNQKTQGRVLLFGEQHRCEGLPSPPTGARSTSHPQLHCPAIAHSQRCREGAVDAGSQLISQAQFSALSRQSFLKLTDRLAD